jgi:GNAT superfamily N-acetyltransferase
LRRSRCHQRRRGIGRRLAQRLEQFARGGGAAGA